MHNTMHCWLLDKFFVTEKFLSRQSPCRACRARGCTCCACCRTPAVGSVVSTKPSLVLALVRVPKPVVCGRVFCHNRKTSPSGQLCHDRRTSVATEEPLSRQKNLCPDRRTTVATEEPPLRQKNLCRDRNP